MKYIVTGMESWAMTDEKTGESKTGIKIHYLPNKPARGDDKKTGLIPVELPGPGDLKIVFKVLPGVYDLEFGARSQKITSNYDGKLSAREVQVLTLEDAAFSGYIIFSQTDVQPMPVVPVGSDVKIAVK